MSVLIVYVGQQRKWRGSVEHAAERHQDLAVPHPWAGHQAGGHLLLSRPWPEKRHSAGKLSVHHLHSLAKLECKSFVHGQDVCHH